SKFYEASEHKIHCRFECTEIIENIPIAIFDCVRILGIILDNAIEATKESENKSLSVMIYQDDEQVEFLIKNSCKETNLSLNELIKANISTKVGHEGLGLNTIQDIKEKNKNIFVQYKKNSKQFVTQIILMW
ncbi:GHKL domain-containing protein, partial [Enterococcus faecalis]|nr:GHKL domain-containing protein [Enterococcus faecalis]